MNKNLKKVISSVVALALSLGSLSAFAASYTDVADTANYATAVNELSALGIVNGYDDGTFQPDKKVTRAEVTKMIVAALAQTAAADAAKGATAFSDVAADHWASGFINIGSSSSGFINGMGDGTFAPESNVTYAQLVKMLVTSLGYGGMALQEGGYPTGYITVGDRIGVTEAVIANANDELTRAQVALLINNSVNLPLLVTTVWSAANPEYEIKDGTGKYFQSLLTEYHDTYKVEGKIVNTSRSVSGLDPDEAYFEIAVADRFDDNYTFSRNDGYTPAQKTVQVIVAEDIDANAELFAYSSALIYKNADDEYELISLSSTAKSKTVELAIGAFDEENKEYNELDNGTPTSGTDAQQAATALMNGESLKFYANEDKSGKVSDYKLASTVRQNNKTTNNVELRVNGVAVTWSQANVEKYIANNEAGKVVLVDAPQDSKATTDGYYDYILVDYYESAVVDEVQANGTVYFDSKAANLNSRIKFDQDLVEDGDLTYTITLDGKEIEFTELQQDDVVSIAYDPTTAFDASAFYDVIVTRGVVEGKVSSEDTADKFYEVNGTTYKFDAANYNDSYPTSVASKNGNTMVGVNATMYVDAFGRVVKLEESSSSKKFAILDNVWQPNGENFFKARIILPDGTTAEYEVKNSAPTDADLNALQNILGSSQAKNPVYNRVMTYKVDSSDRIHSINVLNAAATETTPEEYVARTNKIGSIKMNDATYILDAEDYMKSGRASDLEIVTSLVDSTTYTGYAFDKLSDSTYSFVILTSGKGGYTDDTQIAVFKKYYVGTNEDGDAADAIKVLYNGEEVSLLADDLDAGSVAVANLKKGDVLALKFASETEVKNIAVVGTNLFNANAYNLTHQAPAGVLTEVNEWVGTNNGGIYDTDVDLWYGPIVAKDSAYLSLDAQITSTTDNTWNNKSDKEFSLSDDTKVYVFDYNESGDAQMYAGRIGDIVKSPIASGYKNPTTDAVNWNDVQFGNASAGLDPIGKTINYAFVRADDDDAMEVFVILGEE